MQISYSLINASVEDADWDTQLGYCYAYLFELNKHSFKSDTYEEVFMNLYIADMHFGHGNIIRFDHRPFADSDEMDHVLIKLWNNA